MNWTKTRTIPASISASFLTNNRGNSDFFGNNDTCDSEYKEWKRPISGLDMGILSKNTSTKRNSVIATKYKPTKNFFIGTDNEPTLSYTAVTTALTLDQDTEEKKGYNNKDKEIKTKLVKEDFFKTPNTPKLSNAELIEMVNKKEKIRQIDINSSNQDKLYVHQLLKEREEENRKSRIQTTEMLIKDLTNDWQTLHVELCTLENEVENEIDVTQCSVEKKNQIEILKHRIENCEKMMDDCKKVLEETYNAKNGMEPATFVSTFAGNVLYKFSSDDNNEFSERIPSKNQLTAETLLADALSTPKFGKKSIYDSIGVEKVEVDLISGDFVNEPNNITSSLKSSQKIVNSSNINKDKEIKNNIDESSAQYLKNYSNCNDLINTKNNDFLDSDKENEKKNSYELNFDYNESIDLNNGDDNRDIATSSIDKNNFSETNNEKSNNIKTPKFSFCCSTKYKAANYYDALDKFYGIVPMNLSSKSNQIMKNKSAFSPLRSTKNEIKKFYSNENNNNNKSEEITIKNTDPNDEEKSLLFDNNPKLKKEHETIMDEYTKLLYTKDDNEDRDLNKSLVHKSQAFESKCNSPRSETLYESLLRQRQHSNGRSGSNSIRRSSMSTNNYRNITIDETQSVINSFGKNALKSFLKLSQLWITYCGSNSLPESYHNLTRNYNNDTIPIDVVSVNKIYLIRYVDTNQSDIPFIFDNLDSLPDNISSENNNKKINNCNIVVTDTYPKTFNQKDKNESSKYIEVRSYNGSIIVKNNSNNMVKKAAAYKQRKQQYIVKCHKYLEDVLYIINENRKKSRVDILSYAPAIFLKQNNFTGTIVPRLLDSCDYYSRAKTSDIKYYYRDLHESFYTNLNTQFSRNIAYALLLYLVLHYSKWLLNGIINPITGRKDENNEYPIKFYSLSLLFPQEPSICSYALLEASYLIVDNKELVEKQLRTVSSIYRQPITLIALPAKKEGNSKYSIVRPSFMKLERVENNNTTILGYSKTLVENTHQFVTLETENVFRCYINDYTSIITVVWRNFSKLSGMLSTDYKDIIF